MKKIKTNKKNLIILLTFATLLSAFGLPLTANTSSVDLRTNDITPKSSQFIPRTVRVAIYDEPNVTNPTYSTGHLLTNNFTALISLLESAGFGVTKLTCDDIYNHKLMTADYDVFIMVDNLPRENITNYVKEFWLGGGGVLSFDSALAYLFWSGIVISTEGDDERGNYWGYFSGTAHNVSMRHPITKDYQTNDKFSSAGVGLNAFDWSVVSGDPVGSEIVKLANREGNNDDVTAIALHRSDKGGPIVHLPGRGDTIGINMSNLIIDSVEWLCPRPKGRILFDLSHLPYYGIDSWDITYADYAPRYEIWRDNLVNRSYTLDKFYLGNYTTANLAPYDMLFLCMPEYNFTSNEVTAVAQWVNDGGGLIAIGENVNFADENNNINYLYGSYDLQMVSVTGTSGATYIVEHPTVEGCLEINANGPGAIDYSGDAYPIWGYDDTEIYVAGQEYGNGRVLLMSDVYPFRDEYINSLDNLQYAINVANWLTSGDAEILVYIQDCTTALDFNDDVYKGPVATALNDLGVRYYLTFSIDYFNLSLMEGSYDLAIMDHQQTNIDPYFGDILDYMKSGGQLILSTWTYRLSNAFALWDYLGFEYGGNYYTSPRDIYVWNGAHPIFNSPAPYNTNTLNTTYNWGLLTDYSNLTLHNNATSIAGLTPTAQESGAAIILGAGGRAIVNAMHLTEYYDDTDDSTYPDALEIWENEIAYMLKPGPFSLSSDADSPDTNGMFNLTWTVSDDATEYNIYQHTSLITELAGGETLITGGVTANTYPITGLTNGTYYFIIESTNTYGITLSNCIEITVEIPPDPLDPPGPGPSPGIPGFEIISLISTILISTGVLTLVLFKRNKLR